MIDSKEVTTKVISLCEQILESSGLSTDSALHNTIGWDSVAHVKILLAIEDSFDCTIEPEVFGELKSIEKISLFLVKNYAAPT